MVLQELNDQRLDNYYNQRTGPVNKQDQATAKREFKQIFTRLRLSFHPDKHRGNGLPMRLRKEAQTMASYVENLKECTAYETWIDGTIPNTKSNGVQRVFQFSN